MPTSPYHEFDPTPKVKKGLEDDVARARAALARLTDPKDPLAHEQLPIMSPAHVLYAQGLAFSTVTKAGVGLAGVAGHGFVVRKLEERPGSTGGDGRIAWSAPLFFKVTGITAGLTLGWEKVDSVIVLDTEEAVQGFFKASQGVVDLDAAAVAGGETSISHQSDSLPHSVVAGTDSLQFNVPSRGSALLDLSFKAQAITRDNHRLQEVYGPDVHWEDILAGSVMPPQQLEPLYDDLAALVTSLHKDQPGVLVPLVVPSVVPLHKLESAQVPNPVKKATTEEHEPVWPSARGIDGATGFAMGQLD